MISESAKYVGLDWEQFAKPMYGGVCWGLVHKVFQDYGIELPTYVGDPNLAELVEIEAGLGRGPSVWQEVEPGEERWLDLVTFKLAGCDNHVGIVVNGQVQDFDKCIFLHVVEGVSSRIERYDSNRWKSLVNKFLRHRDLTCT